MPGNHGKFVATTRVSAANYVVNNALCDRDVALFKIPWNISELKSSNDDQSSTFLEFTAKE